MKVFGCSLLVLLGWRGMSLGVLCDLVKARLTGLVLLTVLCGFWLGCVGSVDLVLLLLLLLGTGFLACGAAVLNEYLERDWDGLMERTRGRPIPSGCVGADWALVFGGVLCVLGLVVLGLWVGWLPGLLGVVCLGVYLFVYTPLKRVSSLNTVVGAVAGALPPLMGWAAARGSVDLGGWSLFGVLFFWQLPHFLAIAWLYREEYGRAGFVMLPQVDPSGVRTGRQALCHVLGLLPVSLCPVLLGVAGLVYFVGAFLAGLVFVWFAWVFCRELSLLSARRLFFCSVVYLPLVFGLMVLDRVG